MEHTWPDSVAATDRQPRPQPSHLWWQTASGVAILTVVGLQGMAANAVGELPVTLSDRPDGDRETIDAAAAPEISPDIVAEVAPAGPQPRFSQFMTRAQGLITNKPQQQSVANLSLARLEIHSRDLHRRSNQVEAKLLGLQQLLSLQSYGTSFADRLLAEDATYQAKLQQLQALETEIHGAIEQADSSTLSQLERRLQRVDQDLRQQAQTQLQQYIERAQATSTLGIWQEPMYRESLMWLMEHTHERHLLKARQQTLARTLIAVAPD
ncbi:MAG: hypothetical protein AAFU84_09765 [Cyanobacteria bacterium J06633_23]